MGCGLRWLVVYAHGRVNDPMAKLQFLRVGWSGVGMMTSLNLNTCWMLRNCVCLVIARMLDATQLCLSCHCTHAGCYATVFVLSLHACWMLRNCVCLVIAHMLAATQLCLSCHCTHAGCYATVFVLSLHWANWPTKQTMPEDGEKRRLFFGGWFQYARIPSKTPL